MNLVLNNISLFKNNKYYREENVILEDYHVSLGIINMLCTACLKYVEKKAFPSGYLNFVQVCQKE
jgi:hypothetical protein